MILSWAWSTNFVFSITQRKNGSTVSQASERMRLIILELKFKNNYGGYPRRIACAVEKGPARLRRRSRFLSPQREELVLSAYKKELRSTIGFGIVYVLLGHTGLWAVFLGTDNSVRILGLPVHYFIAITLGSLGVLLWSLVWCRYANKLEDEIEAENAGHFSDAKSVHEGSSLAAMRPDTIGLPEAAK